MVSEHMFVDFDRQLSRGENRPTWLYSVCLMGWFPFGLMVSFGAKHLHCLRKGRPTDGIFCTRDGSALGRDRPAFCPRK